MSYLCSACDEPLPSDATICENCGLVIESVTFSNERNFVAPDASNLANVKTVQRVCHLNRHHYEIIPEGKRSGRKMIEHIGLVLKFGEQLTVAAKELYDRAFDHELFHKCRLRNKMILASACMYITCREWDRVVTLRDIADIARCATNDLDHYKREVMGAFNMKVKSVDLVELAEARCLSLGLGNEVSSLTVQVIKLCQQVWISDGRNPESVIPATTFIAWQAEKPVERLKINLRAFCELFKLTYSAQSNKIVGLIRHVMCELAKEIPWVANGSLQPSRVTLHVKDIIQYQNCLLAETKAKYSALEYVDGSGGDNTESDDFNADETNVAGCDSHNTDTPPAGQLTSLKRKTDECWPLYPFAKSKKAKQQSSAASHTGELVSTRTNLDKEELGVEDIDDNDLHLYIKTEDEIKSELSLTNTSLF